MQFCSTKDAQTNMMIRQALVQKNPEFKIDALKHTIGLIAPLCVLAYALFPTVAPLYTVICLIASPMTWQRDMANKYAFIFPALKNCNNVDDMVKLLK